MPLRATAPERGLTCLAVVAAEAVGRLTSFVMWRAGSRCRIRLAASRDDDGDGDSSGDRQWARAGALSTAPADGDVQRAAKRCRSRCVLRAHFGSRCLFNPSDEFLTSEVLRHNFDMSVDDYSSGKYNYAHDCLFFGSFEVHALFEDLSTASSNAAGDGDWGPLDNLKPTAKNRSADSDIFSVKANTTR
jgi:hypothetical protein